MTNDIVDMKKSGKNKPNDCNISEERPFHVVLVDLKMAAYKEKIRCVEKPLMSTEDLKFVALSYRWGELQETTVDTGVGYLASITSFDLKSFFTLCGNIASEVDLQHMDYVWVDAICVDQTNHDKRKATIYQMTNIYQRANYIVAVPDLHLAHLRTTSKKANDIIRGSEEYGNYIYHLIHGNTKKLVESDHAFLSTQGIPEQDRHLRYMLTKHTYFFTDGMTTCKHRTHSYNERLALEHLYDTTNPASRPPALRQDEQLYRHKLFNQVGYDDDDQQQQQLGKLSLGELHHCDNAAECPLTIYQDTWKITIPERSDKIRQSMDFMADLIMDWSTRVWVISEYHIAKRKTSKKMKYWFIQLDSELKIVNESLRLDQLSFFEFDFDHHGRDPSAPSSLLLPCHGSRGDYYDQLGYTCTGPNKTLQHHNDAVYQTFHTTLQQQLSQPTFLEMILKSKASRNEDRFYAILSSSKYKNKLQSKDQVDQWKINSLLSVKLQLYEWMDIKDKLELLFLSARTKIMTTTLPTFATTRIDWPESRQVYSNMVADDDDKDGNFDLTNLNTLQLVRINNNNGCKLNIKPKEYFRQQGDGLDLVDDDGEKQAKFRTHLQLDVPHHDRLAMICIPNFCERGIKARLEKDNVFWDPSYLFLIGCFEKNKWFLTQHSILGAIIDEPDWQHQACHANSAGFDIY